jgi:hypothetical protein
MSPAEPTLSDVHADLSGRLELDKRLRGVEIEQASQAAAVNGLREEIHAMRTDQKEDKAEIVQAIRDSKVKPWPAVGALAGVMGVLIVVFAAIYGG